MFARERWHDVTDTEMDMPMIVKCLGGRYGRLKARVQQAVRSGQTMRAIQDLSPREDQRDLL